MTFDKRLPTNYISLKGIKVIVRKGVFSPNPEKTNSTLLTLNNLPKINGKEILDVGCGSGIIGIYCALNGAKKVISVDINQKAIKNTKENIKANKIKDIIEVIQSDLFENVTGSFDYIFGNLPISDTPGTWDLETSTIDLIKKFISQCKMHIKKGGRAYFTWYSDADMSATPIKDFLRKEGYKFGEVKEKKGTKTWYLFKIKF